MKKDRVLDIVKYKKIYYAISLVIILAAVIVSFFGVPFSIEFSGGTIINYSYEGEIDLENVENVAEDVANVQATATLGESLGDTNQQSIAISFATRETLSTDTLKEITDKIQSEFSDNNLEVLNTDNVSASSGREFFLKCLVAVGFAAILLVIYIGIRFKKIGGWSAGIMAVIALLHDVLVVYAVFVFFGFPIDSNFIAVVLTILGYSINDTIVIYDRVRENKKILGPKEPIASLVNISVSQTLSRSINTSVSTILAMSVVCIVAFFSGVTSIFVFAFPMIIGMITGVYSTICIATTLWVSWVEFTQRRDAKKKPIKKKK